MQVPPSGPESTSATRAPSFTPCLSALMPAAPPPMTSRSYRSMASPPCGSTEVACRGRPPGSSPPSPPRRNEAPSHVGGAEERGARLEHEEHRDRRHQLREPPLVTERGDERPVGKLRPHLRRDPAAEIDAAHRQRLEGEVARLGAVDRAEDVERLDAERMAAGQSDLGHDGARIAARDPVGEPRRFRPSAGVTEKPINAEETRARE